MLQWPFAGRLEVRFLKFVWPTSFKILFGISIISWLGLIIYGIKIGISKLKEANEK